MPFYAVMRDVNNTLIHYTNCEISWLGWENVDRMQMDPKGYEAISKAKLADSVSHRNK